MKRGGTAAIQLNRMESRRTKENSKMRNIFTTTAGRTNRPPGKPTIKAQGPKAVGTAGVAVVLVLDDDMSVCRSLRRLISAAGFQVQTFNKPSELLASEIPRSNACMVVDIDLPEMTGIQTCEVLRRSGRSLPTILITGRTDAHTRWSAAKSDPIALLFKPFEEELLLDAVGRALALSTQSKAWQ
jgi:FixJ family two-component response regulator